MPVQRGELPTSRELLPAIVSYVRARRCALFVGAGLSRAVGYPDWRGLLTGLIDEVCAFDENPRAELTSLLQAGKFADVADQCRALIGPSGLSAFLRKQLAKPGVEPRPETHGAIVRTPYSCIVTTNFDTLLEQAYAKWGSRGVPKAPTGSELAAHGTLLLDDAFFILKAHGSVTDEGSIVFTTDDYRRIVHANPAFQSVMSTILMTNAIVFVGYSLSDPNFRLLLESQLTTFGAKAPPRYAIMEGAGAYEAALLERTMGVRPISYPKGEHFRVDELLSSIAKASVDPPTKSTRGAPAPAVLDRELTQARTLEISIRTRGPRMDIAWQEALASADGADAGSAGEPAYGSVGAVPWPQLRQRLAPVVDGQGTAAGVREVGMLLASALPATLCDAIVRSSPPLVVFDLDPASASLPWEWTVLGGEPLLHRTAVARTMADIADHARGRPFVHAPLSALIIGDTQPKLDIYKRKVLALPGARLEAENIAGLLRGSGAKVTLLLGRDATYARVMQALRENRFDVVHYAGHAWVEKGAAYMALADHIVYASELATLLNRHPPALFFVNSHHTGFVPAFTRAAPLELPQQASLSDLHSRLDQRRFGFEYVAARAGVGSFVGCLGEVSDQSARAVAERTYRYLMAGETLAAALHRARRESEWSGDTTSYCVLMAGYPGLRLADRPAAPAKGARARARKRNAAGARARKQSIRG